MNLINIIGGIIALTFELYFLIDTIKKPIDKDKDINKDNLGGIIAGIGGIILGSFLIYNEIKKIL